MWIHEGEKYSATKMRGEFKQSASEICGRVGGYQAEALSDVCIASSHIAQPLAGSPEHRPNLDHLPRGRTR